MNEKYVTHDMWQVRPDTWRGVNILSKFQLSSSYGLGVMMFWRLGGKGLPTQWMSELMTKVFLEQPQIYIIINNCVRNNNKVSGTVPI